MLEMPKDIFAESMLVAEKELKDEQTAKKVTKLLYECLQKVVERKATRYEFRVCFYYWYILDLLDQIELMIALKEKYPHTFADVNEKLGKLDRPDKARVTI